MKYSLTALLLFITLVSVSHARDDIGDYSIKDALADADLGSDISFYFGSQKHPPIAKNYGDFPTNRKTNAFNKSDLQACNWVFLSAMNSLRDRARKEGGNAVINIRSNYKNNTTSSENSFKCGAGNVIAGVALIGNVVSLDKAGSLESSAEQESSDSDYDQLRELKSLLDDGIITEEDYEREKGEILAR
jgi:hypothetical protein